MIWTITGELFPSRYRAKGMSLSIASNWLWNFLLAFFTPFITSAIDFRYGYVFAGCNVLGGLLVFFFVIEGKTPFSLLPRPPSGRFPLFINQPKRKSLTRNPPKILGQGRTLEELDTMYIERVLPWKSSKWEAPTAAEIARIRKEAGTHEESHIPDGGSADADMERGTLSGETERPAGPGTPMPEVEKEANHE